MNLKTNRKAYYRLIIYSRIKKVALGLLTHFKLGFAYISIFRTTRIRNSRQTK